MTASYKVDPTTVARYLAGQMSDQEMAGFESYMTSHPDVLRELEEVAQFKVGLAKLRDRGELVTLTESPPNSEGLK